MTKTRFLISFACYFDSIGFNTFQSPLSSRYRWWRGQHRHYLWQASFHCPWKSGSSRLDYWLSPQLFQAVLRTRRSRSTKWMSLQSWTWQLCSVSWCLWTVPHEVTYLAGCPPRWSRIRLRHTPAHLAAGRCSHHRGWSWCSMLWHFSSACCCTGKVRPSDPWWGWSI